MQIIGCYSLFSSLDLILEIREAAIKTPGVAWGREFTRALKWATVTTPIRGREPHCEHYLTWIESRKEEEKQGSKEDVVAHPAFRCLPRRDGREPTKEKRSGKLGGTP